MKFIYFSIYRLRDKQVLLRIANSHASSQMQERASKDFDELTKTFRKSGLYEGMRDTDYDVADDYPSEL